MIISLLPIGLANFRAHLASSIFYFRETEKSEYLYELVNKILEEKLPKSISYIEIKNLLTKFFQKEKLKRQVTKSLYFLLSDIITYKILNIDSLIEYAIKAIEIGMRYSVSFKNLVVLDISIRPRKTHYLGREMEVSNLSVYSLDDDGIYSIPIWGETLPQFSIGNCFELNQTCIIPYIGEIYKWRSDWPPLIKENKEPFSCEGLQFTAYDFDMIYRSFNLHKFVPNPRSPKGLLTTYGVINGKIEKEKILLPESTLIQIVVKDWSNYNIAFEIDTDKYAEICKKFGIQNLEGLYAQVLLKQEFTYRKFPKCILLDIKIVDEDTCYKNFILGYLQHRRKVKNSEFDKIQIEKHKIKTLIEHFLNSRTFLSLNDNIVYVPPSLRKFERDNWSRLIFGEGTSYDKLGFEIEFGKIVQRNPLIRQLYTTTSIEEVYKKVKDFSKIMNIGNELLKAVNYRNYCEKNKIQLLCSDCLRISNSKECPFKKYLGVEIEKWRWKLRRMLTWGGDIKEVKELISKVTTPCLSPEAKELTEITKEIMETIIL